MEELKFNSDFGRRLFPADFVFFTFQRIIYSAFSLREHPSGLQNADWGMGMGRGRPHRSAVPKRELLTLATAL